MVDFVKVEFRTPIKDDKDKEIKELTLRKFTTGELRGLNILNIINGDVTTIEKLLQRISTPVLSASTFHKIPPLQFTEIYEALGVFFGETPPPKTE